MMKVSWWVVGMWAVCLLAGCVAPPPAAVGAVSTATPISNWPGEDWLVSMPAEQGMDGEGLEAAWAQAEQSGLQVHALLVIRHGAIVLEKYAPGHGREELHPLYSVTKSVVGTLTGMALDRGQLTGVDQPLAELFPGRAFAQDPQKAAMRLEDLLTMTTGLDWEENDAAYTALYRSADWVDAVMDLPLRYPPGEEFNYCTGCSHVLLKAVEAASGQDAIDNARDDLFNPMGIHNFTWDRTSLGDAIGGWGLSLSARDLARLGMLYLHQGAWNGRQLVSAGWVQEATRAHSHPEGRLEYGYQWWVYDRPGTYAALGHGGQMLFVAPDLDLIVVTTAEINGHDPLFALLDDFILPAARP